jgi:hypothetical protein
MMLPEIELALLLSRTPLVDERKARANVLLSGSVDWKNFFAFAVASDIEAVAMTNLVSLNRALLPEQIIAKASGLAHHARAIALSRSLVTGDLVARFNGAGMPVIVLKGGALGVAAYGDPSLRMFSDVDLLLAKEDLARGREFLMRMGYRPCYDLRQEPGLIDAEHALEFSNEHTKVELHWSLMSRHLRISFDLNAIWLSPGEVEVAGSRIQVLAPEINFLFLCAHGAKHEWMRLRWLCDIAQLAERQTELQWSKTVDLAQRLHAWGLLSLGLTLIRDAFGETYSREIPVGRPLRDSRALSTKVLRRLGLGVETNNVDTTIYSRIHPGLSALLFWTSTRERVRDRAGCMIDVITGSASAEARTPLGWLARPVRLTTGAVRRAKGAH